MKLVQSSEYIFYSYYVRLFCGVVVSCDNTESTVVMLCVKAGLSL